MTDFYNTQRGHDFYEYQLPKLIRGVERIADLLEKQNQSVQMIPIEASNDFLERLYFGNMEPQEEIKGIELSTYQESIIQILDDLREQITKEQWESVEELITLYGKRSSSETALGLRTGFRMAMQMVVAGMGPLGTVCRKEEEGR